MIYNLYRDSTDGVYLFGDLYEDSRPPYLFHFTGFVLYPDMKIGEYLKDDWFSTDYCKSQIKRCYRDIPPIITEYIKANRWLLDIGANKRFDIS